jgi:hypothetical protein
MSGKKLSFLEIAKLNKDKIVKKELIIVEEAKKVKKDDNNNDNDNEEFNDDINIKNSDREFEKIYDMKIIDIKCEFLELIRKNYTYNFFFNNHHNTLQYNFYDFIKHCSNNYYNIIKNTNNENNSYLELLEEEERKKEEYEENYENDENYYPYKY